MTYQVLGIIPARGGSKGVPKKNIKLLNNKPLLQYTAESALASQMLSHVVLSTDDPEIAEIGCRCGLDVPYLRPSELAQDDTPTLPVLQHMVSYLEKQGKYYHAVCLLQPTTPFRRSDTIDQCVKLLLETEADSIVTILRVPEEYNPHWVYFQREDGSLYLSTGEPYPITRRQLLPPAYHREGSVYITRRSVLMEKNSLYGDKTLGFPVTPEESVNIDTLRDWEKAEKMALKILPARKDM